MDQDGEGTGWRKVSRKESQRSMKVVNIPRHLEDEIDYCVKVE